VTEQVSLLAKRSFVESCRSPATRRHYIKAVKYFMRYLNLPSGSYDKLIEKDPKLIQMDICDFISYLKERKNSSATISLYLAAIAKFYTMNDLTPQLNWKKITSFKPENEQTVEDRPYTHSEIHKLISHASTRDRAMILLMCSAGLRVGGVAELKIKDLVANERFNNFKITAYAKSRKSRYYTWCTPECRKVIEDYLDYRKRSGERLSDDTPLFRADYNSLEIQRVRPIKDKSIGQAVYVLLKRVGLRQMLSTETQGHKRSNIMQTHGCRKFFETNAYKAGMDPMYIRRLMGQNSGLEDSYLKLSEEELLEGDNRHVGYIGIIDQLTINEEYKLRREVHTLKQEITRFDKMQKQIEELNRRMGLTS
jgi:site-specific recombinase XerD